VTHTFFTSPNGAKFDQDVHYDAEVEYLETSGNGAYIDTGIECTGDLSIDCMVYWSTDVNAHACGGIKNMGGSTYFRHHLSPCTEYGTHTLYYYQCDAGDPSIVLEYGPTGNAWRHFSLNATTGAWEYADVSGSVTPLSGSYTTGKNYGIFARISSDGSISTRPCRFAYFKLSRNGVLLRDFIPVRAGSTGYMYDRVSGTLFRNVGSGSFSVGPDK